MGSKGAGGYYRGMSYGNGLSNYRKTRESSFGAIQSQFRLDWDVENLKRALDRVGVDGDKYVKAVLHETAQMAVSKVQRMLKKEAEPYAGGKVPPDHRTIYETVGNALKAETVAGNSFIRIHTGESPKTAHLGVRSKTRPSGHLAEIVATGFAPFAYGKLPFNVRSSVRHYDRTGNAIDISRGMLKQKFHPGFKGFDYMLEIEEDIMEGFEEDIQHHMEFMGRQYGFTTSLGYKEGL